MRYFWTRICLLCSLLPAGVIAHAQEWERIYPEAPATVVELPLMSVGMRSTADGPEYLAGSRSGYVLVSDFRSVGPQNVIPVKLPVPFDIQAITTVQGNWIIAGPGGQVAYQIPSDSGNGESPIEALVAGWQLSQLPQNESIVELAANGNSVLAMSEDSVFASVDAGATWQEQEGLYLVKDIQQFRDKLYAIRSELRATTWELELLRSTNGIAWERVWDIVCPRSHEARYLRTHEVELMVVSNQVDPDGFPIVDSERLYLFADLEDGKWNPEEFVLNLSSPDGIEWFDHQSENDTFNRIHNNVFNELLHWNPLGLDASHLNYPVPARRSSQVAGNLRTLNNQLERFDGTDWELKMQTRPRDMVNPDTTTVWDTLSFIYDHEKVVSLNDNDNITEFDLPELPDSNYYLNEWRQMVVADGTYYTIAGKDLPPYNWELYPALRITDNFIDWDFIPWPVSRLEENSLKLHVVKNQLLSTYQVTECEYLDGGNLSICMTYNFVDAYDSGWTNLESGSQFESCDNAAVYYPPHQTFYSQSAYEHANGTGLSISLWFNFPPDGLTWYPFPTLTYPEAFTNLAVPDGKTLLAFGDTANLAIVDEDGNQRIASLTGLLPPYNQSVNAITLVNGWYYVVGSALLRTKDFVEFESLELANGEPMTNVVGYRGFLYGFTRGAVYRTPMERGYLDSIEMVDGWYHSEWLGWFQIINQELGDIEHLLLGTCWVKPVDDREYWLRTPQLGWIMMIKDWSPWFWRLDDGHWYWLEQDAWPPKAFDYDDQEWVQLKP